MNCPVCEAKLEKISRDSQYMLCRSCGQVREIIKVDVKTKEALNSLDKFYAK